MIVVSGGTVSFVLLIACTQTHLVIVIVDIVSSRLCDQFTLQSDIGYEYI